MDKLKRLASQGKATLTRSEKKELAGSFTVHVRLLDDYQASLKIEAQKDTDALWLFDEICERLGGLQEKDYFGLRYTDKDKQRQWLDLSRNVYKQLKDTNPTGVSFRVKHYPKNPADSLQQEISRYLLYLQLRRDLYNGRLLGKSSDMYQLASYVVQAELGSSEDQEENFNYLSGLRVLPHLNPKMENKIIEAHKKLENLSTSEAETLFLKLASSLDTYGVEPFYVKDQKGNNLYLGLTHEGISTFQGSRRAHLFTWSDINKIHHEGKLFIIQVVIEDKRHILGFKCESRFTAAALWTWAVDRECFFTLERGSQAHRHKSGGGLFRRRHKFRFSGRSLNEVTQLSKSIANMPQPDVQRSRSLSLLVRRHSVAHHRNLDDGRFNTLPGRIRKKSSDTTLNHGTSGTLDSLFIQHHGNGISLGVKAGAAVTDLKDRQLLDEDDKEKVQTPKDLPDGLPSNPDEQTTLGIPNGPTDDVKTTGVEEVISRLDRSFEESVPPSTSFEQDRHLRSAKSGGYCYLLGVILFLLVLFTICLVVVFERGSRHDPTSLLGQIRRQPWLETVHKEIYVPLRSKII